MRPYIHLHGKDGGTPSCLIGHAIELRIVENISQPIDRAAGGLRVIAENAIYGSKHEANRRVVALFGFNPKDRGRGYGIVAPEVKH